ncbi:MAG: 5'-nucleotidase C-terminal domain-containing protein [Chitinophagaceae bacterium]
MKIKSFLGFFLIVFVGCVPSQRIQKIQYSGYAVGQVKQVDSSYIKMLSTYADSVNKTMGEFLVENETDLNKETPNSPLGNFLADAYLWAAKTKMDSRAEIAFMNHGGVRINRLGKGPIKRGMIYEVMPFDNVLVLVEVKGNILKDYLDRIAFEGGGGGVAGVSMRIEEKKAVDILINGEPIDLSRTYYMVNSDYQVDGGGGFTAFKKLTQNRSGYLQRDAIIDYCRSNNLAGKKINTEPKIRIRK